MQKFGTKEHRSVYFIEIEHPFICEIIGLLVIDGFPVSIFWLSFHRNWGLPSFIVRASLIFESAGDEVVKIT